MVHTVYVLVCLFGVYVDVVYCTHSGLETSPHRRVPYIGLIQALSYARPNIPQKSQRRSQIQTRERVVLESHELEAHMRRQDVVPLYDEKWPTISNGNLSSGAPVIVCRCGSTRAAYRRQMLLEVRILILSRT